MDTRKSLSLAKSITSKTGHSTCIEHIVWYHEDGVKQKYYKLIWFKEFDDCEIERFKTFQSLITFAKEKWDVC